MPKSPAFIRIKRDVLTIMAAVPPGRVVTYVDVGRHLDIAPRHVAYILSTLDPLEKAGLPWHRAVAGDGGLGVPKHDGDGRSQAELLEEEGVAVGPGRRLRDLPAHIVPLESLPHGVPVQTRPGGTGC